MAFHWFYYIITCLQISFAICLFVCFRMYSNLQWDPRGFWKLDNNTNNPNEEQNQYSIDRITKRGSTNTRCPTQKSFGRCVRLNEKHGDQIKLCSIAHTVHPLNAEKKISAHSTMNYRNVKPSNRRYIKR